MWVLMGSGFVFKKYFKGFKIKKIVALIGSTITLNGIFDCKIV